MVLFVGKMCVKIPRVGRLRRLSMCHELNCVPTNPILILSSSPQYLQMCLYFELGAFKEVINLG